MYALTLCTNMPAASAMHGPLDHEHGRWGIHFFWIILILLLLLCLAYAIGRRRGMRLQQARQSTDASEALARLESLQQQQRNDRHDVEAQRMRDEIEALRKLRHELRSVRASLEHERRSANVMAIMMAYQINQIRSMTGRIDRLRSLITNHQPGCPLGDTILVQENLDGAQWHIDPECPVLQLN